MKTTIDKAGRVVIPLALRKRAGLTPGSELQITYEEGSIRMTRRTDTPEVVEHAGRLLVRPKRQPSEAVDPAALVEEERSRWPL